MDCLAFVVIEISGSWQSICRIGADLGEFCAAVLRRLATAKQINSESQGSQDDGPISHLIPPEPGPTSNSMAPFSPYPKPSHRQKTPTRSRAGGHRGCARSAPSSPRLNLRPATSGLAARSRLASPRAPATGNAGPGLRFDWAAPVAEIPLHLLAHSPSCFVGQRGQCLLQIPSFEHSILQAVTTIGLDIAKSVFQIHGIEANGNVMIRP